MTIRKAKKTDIPEMLRVTAAAKQLMRSRGNYEQWNAEYPGESVWSEDINNGNAYVVLNEGRIVCAFAFIFGEDPTYAYIEDGSWPDNEPYATLHRVASDGSVHGIIKNIVDYCSLRTARLRADTHEINFVMKKALENSGFARCGIIYLADGAPRVAYFKKCGELKESEDQL